MKISKTFQNLLLFFSLYLYYAPDYAFFPSHPDQYQNFGILNLLDDLHPSAKIIINVIFSIAIIKELISLLQVKVSQSIEIIELFIFPIQNYLCWREFSAFDEKNMLIYLIYGINLMYMKGQLRILYSFTFMKTFYIKNRYKNSVSSYIKLNRIPYVLAIIRIIILSLAPLHLNFYLYMIPLAIIQFGSIVLKMHYIIYEDPEFDYINTIIEIWGIFALVKHCLAVFNLNSVSLNLVVLILGYMVICPLQSFFLLWENKIGSIIKNYQPNQNSFVIINLIYFNYFCRKGSIQVKDQSKCKIISEFMKVSNISGINEQIFFRPHQSHKQILQFLWEYASKLKILKKLDYELNKFLSVFFLPLLQVKPVNMFYFYYKAKLAEKKRNFFEEGQLLYIHKLLNTHKLGNRNLNILKYDEELQKIDHKFRKYIQKQENFFKYSKISTYSLSEIQNYLSQKSSFKCQLHENIENLKLLAPLSNEAQFLQYFYLKYLKKENTPILAKSIFICAQKNNYFESQNFFSNLQNYSNCFIKALETPGKIHCADASFYNLVSYSDEVTNINDFLPLSIRDTHRELMNNALNNGEINDHSKIQCYIQTLKQKILEVNVRVSLYVDSQKELYYFLQINPVNNGKKKIINTESEQKGPLNQEIAFLISNFIKKEKNPLMEKFASTFKIISQSSQSQKKISPEIECNVEKFQKFKQKKQKVNIFQNRLCTLFLSASFFLLATVFLVIRFQTMFFKLSSQSSSIQNFHYSYFKDLGIYEILLPAHELMLSFGSENHTAAFQQSQKIVQNDWKMKESFFQSVFVNLDYKDFREIVFENLISPPNKTLLIPFYYIVEESGKINEKISKDIQNGEDFSINYQMQEEKKRFYFSLDNILGQFSKSFSDLLAQLLLTVSLTSYGSICIIFLLLLLFLYTFLKFEEQVVNLCLILKQINKVTCWNIILENKRLLELMKISSKDKEKQKNFKILQQNAYDFEECNSEFKEKPLIKDFPKEKKYTASFIAFSILIFLLFICLSFFMIKITFLFQTNNQSYETSFEGLQEFSAGVNAFVCSFFYLDFKANNITSVQWYEHNFTKILDFNINQAINKLVEDDKEQQILFDNVCDKYINCDEIAIQDRDSLINILSSTKNQLRAFSHEIQNSEGRNFEENKEVFTSLLKKVTLLVKIYSKILDFASENIKTKQVLQILNLCYLLIIPLFLIILLSIIFILHSHRKGKIYQEEIFNLGEPSTLYETHPFRYYINSIYYRTNFAEKLSQI